MAIVPMKHLELYGLVRHKTSFLSELQRLGLVEIKALPGEGEESHSEPQAELRKELSAIDERLHRINQVLAILERFVPQRPNFIEQFAGMKTVLTWEEQQNFLARERQFTELCQEVITFEEEYGRLKQEQLRLERRIGQLKPWVKLDLPREAWSGSARIQILLGSFADNPEVLTQALQDEGLSFTYRELGEYANRFYLIFFCRRAEKGAEILRNKGFVPSVPEMEAGRVRDYLGQLAEDERQLKTRLETIESTFQDWARQRPFFQTFYDYWHNYRRQVEAHRRLLQGKAVFALEGWVEAEQAARVQRVLSALGLPHCLQFRAPHTGEEVPIALKNPPVFTPFETLVESFSYPRTEEIDPSAAIAPFFFLCFGLALGDAGYGLILALLCGVLLWKLTMRPGGRKMAGLLLASGLGAVFVGLLTPSIFGYAPYPGLLNFVDQPQLLLLVALGLGLLQLYAGTVLNAWINIKQGQWGDALWQQGSWLLFLTGILLTVGGPQIGWGRWAWEFKTGTILAAVLMVLGNTRGKKGLLGKLKAIPTGLLDIYGSVGFFSDVLSYSRLMALGLSGAVMGSIINMFVEMTWAIPVIGWLFAILIFLFGHALNMGLNILGAYVHSSRLQYLEFFNTFFTGGGQPFTPLKLENVNVFLKKEREV